MSRRPLTHAIHATYAASLTTSATVAKTSRPPSRTAPARDRGTKARRVLGWSFSSTAEGRNPRRIAQQECPMPGQLHNGRIRAQAPKGPRPAVSAGSSSRLLQKALLSNDGRIRKLQRSPSRVGIRWRVGCNDTLRRLAGENLNQTWNGFLSRSNLRAKGSGKGVSPYALAVHVFRLDFHSRILPKSYLFSPEMWYISLV